LEFIISWKQYFMVISIKCFKVEELIDVEKQDEDEIEEQDSQPTIYFQMPFQHLKRNNK